MDTSLTIVLPVHNGEKSLATSVNHVLEIAMDLTDRFDVIVVDDGSTDDTFDIAQELASLYPQVEVRRNATRRGLGPILEAVKQRNKSDLLIVHDGVSPLNAEQVRALWINSEATQDQISIRDLHRPGINQQALEATHQRLFGFQIISDVSSRQSGEGKPRTVAPPHTKRRKDSSLGHIPTLPSTGMGLSGMDTTVS